MGRLTETRDGRNVVPLRYGSFEWTLETHCTPECLKERFLSGYPADRLAAYEDTGLEPEEIKTWQDTYNEFLTRTYGPFHKKITDWLNAEREGRLAILPCKVGDIVYAAETDPVIPLHVMALAVYLEGKEGGDFEMLSNIGNTVFLSREEAAMKLHETKSECGCCENCNDHREGEYETAAKTERLAD